MAQIASRTEHSKYDDLALRRILRNKAKVSEAISSSAQLLAKDLKAQAILVTSLSGQTARYVSSYRPELPIFVATNSEKVKRQLNLSWGVVPFVLPRCKTIEELTDRSLAYLRINKLAKIKDKIIIIAGFPVGRSGTINWINIHEIK